MCRQLILSFRDFLKVMAACFCKALGRCLLAKQLVAVATSLSTEACLSADGCALACLLESAAAAYLSGEKGWLST